MHECKYLLNNNRSGKLLLLQLLFIIAALLIVCTKGINTPSQDFANKFLGGTYSLFIRHAAYAHKSGYKYYTS